jgi:hypothetical protein
MRFFSFIGRKHRYLIVFRVTSYVLMGDMKKKLLCYILNKNGEMIMVIASVDG